MLDEWLMIPGASDAAVHVQHLGSCPGTKWFLTEPCGDAAMGPFFRETSAIFLRSSCTSNFNSLRGTEIQQPPCVAMGEAVGDSWYPP